MPNQLPLYCDVNPAELAWLQPQHCVWEMFKKSGAVTMMGEEIHDQCETANAVVQVPAKLGRWWLRLVPHATHTLGSARRGQVC
jgi:hypothetical protein